MVDNRRAAAVVTATWNNVYSAMAIGQMARRKALTTRRAAQMTRREMVAMMASGRVYRRIMGRARLVSGEHSETMMMCQGSVLMSTRFCFLVNILPLHRWSSVANIRLNLTKITPNIDNCTSSWTKRVVDLPTCSRSWAMWIRRSGNIR